MTEPRGNVLPIYFVADESGSMIDDMEDLNVGLSVLLDTLHAESMAAAKVRFSVIGFGTDAAVYLHAVDLREIDEMPKLQTRGMTNYSTAFNTLRTAIPDDVDRLKSEGYLVNRPAVFFLSDGVPTDDWEESLHQLTSESFKYRPNILAFGIGSANGEIIKQVATSPEYAFIAADGTDTGKAITEFVKALTQSVVSSAQALGTGSAELPIEKPDGFISLSVDTL